MQCEISCRPVGCLPSSGSGRVPRHRSVAASALLLRRAARSHRVRGAARGGVGGAADARPVRAADEQAAYGANRCDSRARADRAPVAEDGGDPARNRARSQAERGRACRSSRCVGPDRCAASAPQAIETFGAARRLELDHSGGAVSARNELTSSRARIELSRGTAPSPRARPRAPSVVRALVEASRARRGKPRSSRARPARAAQRPSAWPAARSASSVASGVSSSESSTGAWSGSAG